jgi:hypothetical protein
LGLAAIAAAAAVNPAASISRLIAALAILSKVVLFAPLLLLAPRREVFAIAASHDYSVRTKRFRPETVPK